jgi:hypothetical protein
MINAVKLRSEVILWDFHASQVVLGRRPANACSARIGADTANAGQQRLRRQYAKIPLSPGKENRK